MNFISKSRDLLQSLYIPSKKACRLTSNKKASITILQRQMHMPKQTQL